MQHANTQMSDQLKTAIRSELVSRGHVNVQRVSRALDIPAREVGRILCQTYNSGDLRMCGSNGELHAHTHVKFNGEVFKR